MLIVYVHHELQYLHLNHMLRLIKARCLFSNETKSLNIVSLLLNLVTFVVELVSFVKYKS